MQILAVLAAVVLVAAAQSQPDLECAPEDLVVERSPAEEKLVGRLSTVSSATIVEVMDSANSVADYVNCIEADNVSAACTSSTARALRSEYCLSFGGGGGGAEEGGPEGAAFGFVVSLCGVRRSSEAEWVRGRPRSSRAKRRWVGGSEAVLCDASAW